MTKAKPWSRGQSQGVGSGPQRVPHESRLDEARAAHRRTGTCSAPQRTRCALGSLQEISNRETYVQMSYWRFAAMVATSTVVMFGLMYLNTYQLDHVFFSQTRAWMALVMGAAMAIVMLAFMQSMYRNRRLNAAILFGSAALFAVSLWLVRSQATVGDVAYMRAMIPHHSIAILTSSRANIHDPRVRKLADGIIEAQQREIAEMKRLIAELGSD